jgi:hypothetical protein
VNAVVPTALALAGTALMAVAIFGPFRRTASTGEEPAAPAAVAAGPTLAPVTVAWPALVEASAIACDAQARIDLADALGALRSPWSESVLRQAHDSEPDPAVRAAIEAALSSTESLVT